MKELDAIGNNSKNNTANQYRIKCASTTVPERIRRISPELSPEISNPAIRRENKIGPPGCDLGKTSWNGLDIFEVGILETLPTAVVVHNPDSSIRYVNPAMEKLTGFSKEEVIDRKAPYPWWPKETAARLARKFKKTISQGIIPVDCCFRNKMGEEFWAEVSAVSLKTGGRVTCLISNLVDITERKRMREGTEFYIREMTRVQEDERKRIARELHDDTAQSLAFLALELDSLIRSSEITSEKIVRRLQFLKEQTNNSLREVRRFSHELRPGVLDQLGLIAAIELLVDELNARNTLSIQFGVTGQERRLSNEEEQALFRISQEALSNIRKHSQATRAEVLIKFSQNNIRLTILDNGKGFHPGEIDNAIANGRLGLVGMRERAYLIGAVLAIKSAPGKGARVSINLKSRLRSRKYAAEA